MTRKPSPLADLLALDPADVRAVGDWFRRFGADGITRDHFPEFPDPDACSILGDRVLRDNGWPLCVPKSLQVLRFAQGVGSTIGEANPKFHSRRTLTALEAIYEEVCGEIVAASSANLGGDIEWMSMMLSKIDTIKPIVRRLDSSVILLAQVELRPCWVRIEAEDWPIGRDAMSLRGVLERDASTLAERARVQVRFLVPPSGSDFHLTRHTAPVTGLRLAYWVTLAHYVDAYHRLIEPPAPTCPYCDQPLKTWRSDIRTCGAKECERRYEADRRWLRRNDDMVRPVVRASDLMLQQFHIDEYDIHPGRARQAWAAMGFATDRRRKGEAERNEVLDGDKEARQRRRLDPHAE